MRARLTFASGRGGAVRVLDFFRARKSSGDDSGKDELSAPSAACWSEASAP